MSKTLIVSKRVSAAAGNAGGWVNGASGSRANFAGAIGTNGAPIAADTGATGTDDAASVITLAGGVLTAAGIADDSLDGVLVYLSGTNCTEGRYVIASNSAAADTITLTANASSGGAMSDLVVNVGGALDDIQDAFDLLTSGGDECLICTDTETATEYPITAGLNPNVTSFSDTTTIRIRGCDVTDGGWLEDTEAKPVIMPGANISTGLLDFDADNIDGYHIYDLTFNGTDGGTFEAEYAISASGGAVFCLFNKFIRLNIINANSHGVNWNDRGDPLFISCNISNNGGKGILMRYTSVCYTYRCIIQNNGSDGMFTYYGSVISQCLITDNVGTGITYYRWFIRSTIIGNTIANNGSDGLFIDLTDTVVPNSGIIDNNIFYGNSGYAVNFDNSVYVGKFIAVTKNCIYDNTSNTINNWNSLLDDSTNIVADPLFVSESIGDYRLLYNSPCYNGTTGEIIGALSTKKYSRNTGRGFLRGMIR